MRKILIVFCIFSLITFFSGSAVLADPDSVNWGNLNLTYKPPKVDEGETHGRVVEVQPTLSDSFAYTQELMANYYILQKYTVQIEDNPKTDPLLSETLKYRTNQLDMDLSLARSSLFNTWNYNYQFQDKPAAGVENNWEVDSSYFYRDGFNLGAQYRYSDTQLDTNLQTIDPWRGYQYGSETQLDSPALGLESDYNAPYLDELTLQFEQALTDDLAVSLTGFYRKKHNLAYNTGSAGSGAVDPAGYQTGPPGIGGTPGVNNIPTTEWSTFAPRVGLTYDIAGDGQTAIKSNYSIYSQPSFSSAVGGPLEREWQSSYSDYNRTLSGTGPLFGGAQTQVTGGFNYGVDRGIGELYGFGGPAISCGKVGKVCTLAIFDNNARLIGTVNQGDLERDPFKTHRLLNVAEESSRRNFSRTLHSGGLASCSERPLIDSRGSSASTVVGDEITDLPVSGRSFADVLVNLPQVSSGFQLADGGHDTNDAEFINNSGPGTFPADQFEFKPGGILGTQLGSSPGDLAQAGDLLNAQLNCKSTGFANSNCFADFNPCNWAYTVEDAYFRFPLKKKKGPQPTSLDPNDPYYWWDYGKKKSKVRERLKKISKGVNIGAGIGIGGGSMGGASFGKDKSPEAKDQWGLRKIGFLPKSEEMSAWNVIDGSEKNTLIAVIDSGLDTEHEDAPEYIWSNPNEIPGNGIDDDYNGYVDDIHGWNFVMNDNDLRDFYGHGTFVSGIIAAKANNGLGIAGINPGAELMVLKVVNKEGESNSLNIYRAILYAVNHGARIINISLGAKGISKMEQLAINRAAMSGVLVIVASGNVNENIGEHGPAAAERVIAVGAIDVKGGRSPISNWGANNGLLAPGEAIWSLRSKDSYDPRAIKKEFQYYYPENGTSFAAPMVTATASLLLAKNPMLTNMQIEDILIGTAADLDKERGEGADWDAEAGAGILNAADALRANPDDFSMVKLTKIRINKNDKKKVDSVDIFASVRGKKLKEFVVGVGKGNRAKKFTPVAGPYYYSADHAWVARIDKNELKGSSEWIVEIKATDVDGNHITAQSPFKL